MRISDWSSDVCSSDLRGLERRRTRRPGHPRLHDRRDAAEVTELLAPTASRFLRHGRVIQPGGAAVGVAVAAACPVGLTAGPLFDGSPLQAQDDTDAYGEVSGGDTRPLAVAQIASARMRERGGQ